MDISTSSIVMPSHYPSTILPFKYENVFYSFHRYKLEYGLLATEYFTYSYIYRSFLLQFCSMFCKCFYCCVHLLCSQFSAWFWGSHAAVIGGPPGPVIRGCAQLCSRAQTQASPIESKCSAYQPSLPPQLFLLWFNILVKLNLCFISHLAYVADIQMYFGFGFSGFFYIVVGLVKFKLKNHFLYICFLIFYIVSSSCPEITNCSLQHIFFF